MKTPLATMVVTLLLAAGPALSFAAEAGSDPTPQAAETGEQSSSAPAESSAEEGAMQEEKPDETTGSDRDVMQNVTRHRPGACPEGPPCKSED